MPRGVYPRDQRVEKAEKKVEKVEKVEKTEKIDIPKMAKTLKAPKTPKMIKTPKKIKVEKVSSKSASVDPTALPIESQFDVLVSNAMCLGQIRSMNVGRGVCKEVDSEILRHVFALRALRRQIFGTTTEELTMMEISQVDLTEMVTSQEETQLPGCLPLPAKPLIQVPHTS